MKLKTLLPVLPRYSNNFKKGPYKDGNYRQVYVCGYKPCKSYFINLNNIPVDEIKDREVESIEADATAFRNYTSPWLTIYIKGGD